MRTVARASALLLASSALGLVQDRLDPFAMERLLAPGAFLYLSVPQSPAAAQDYAGSAVRRFWENEEIRAFKAPIEAWWAARKIRAVELPGRPASPAFNDVVREAAGLSIDELWRLFSGPFSAAVYDLPLGGGHGLDLVLALGAPDADLLRRLSGRAKEAFRNAGGLEERTFAHAGLTLHELGGDEVRIFYGYIENHLVVTTARERLEQIATSSAKRTAAALRDDPAFKAARARVSPDGRHLLHVHANTAEALRRFGPDIGDEGLKLLEAFGAADVESVDAAWAYDGGFLRERYSLRTSRQDRGLLKILAGRAAKDPAASAVPAGALVYAHAAIDLAEVYDAVQEASKADPEAEEAFAGAVEEFEAETGLNLRAALGSLGTSWTAWTVYPEGGGLLPYEIAALELRDPAIFAASLRKLAEAFGRRIERQEFRGRTIEHLTLPLLPGPDDVDPSFDPGLFAVSYPLAWTLEGRRLYVSSNPLAIKRQILRGAAPEKPLGRDPRFAALAARVPADAWESWVYADLGRAFAALYTTAEPFLHVARDLPRDPQTGELIVDLARLPMGETLSDLIGPALTHKRTLPDGLLVESWSNLGLSYTAVVALAVAAGAAIPLALQRQMAAAEPQGPAANELIAQLSLQLIRQAQETFKDADADGNGAKDYWTRDVGGLYGLKDGEGRAVFLIDPQTAAADPDGAARYGLAPAPKNGYFFKAMATDPDGRPYRADEDRDGNAFTNRSKYGVTAWPAQPGFGGRFTFILDETGKVWKKDTEGRPVDRWPGKDPAQDGWAPAD